MTVPRFGLRLHFAGCLFVTTLADLCAGNRARAQSDARPDQVQITHQLHERAKQQAMRPHSTPDERTLQQRSAQGCVLPLISSRPVHHEPVARFPTLSWMAPLLQPTLIDHQLRMPPRPEVQSFGHTLRPGERFVFDVTYAGNAAGYAEVLVADKEPKLPDSPYPGGSVFRIEGRVRSSGVLSLLTTVTDHMTSWIDAETGAPLRVLNILDQEGIGAKYKHRETLTEFQGRGYVRIHDVRDEKVRNRTRHLPADTFDPMAAIAWVRGLEIDPGQTVTAHALDGSALLRMVVTHKGPSRLEPLPSVAAGLGVRQEFIDLYEGRLTRVDRYDRPILGKREFGFRAWVDRRAPKLLLALESDMWIGVVKILLSRYEPPTGERGNQAASKSRNAGSASAPSNMAATPIAKSTSGS